ncbi:hypothetical protein HOK51_00525 [Candidatus Woesearchaeota archaeon]|jgi:hypothetical protein|nr:hypothetical protein [Candidatus Woesearchaeota archaeon]MBT6518298.1 hypothetical protein [Candidatus Woesearchaeota archaeon]MBT7367081.1 hypothetical protein [Candidatus Woesearchaeota archaeon]
MFNFSFFKKSKKSEPVRDFALVRNNSVVALYVTNPEMLNRGYFDDIGKPFLFWTQEPNRRSKDSVTGLYCEGLKGLPVYVGTHHSLEQFISGRNLTSDIPEIMVVRGEEVPETRICRSYVPFSGGVYHEWDVGEYLNGKRHIRTNIESLKEMINSVPSRL